MADEQLDICVDGISELTAENMYTTSDISDIENRCPLLFDALKDLNIGSAMLIRTGAEAADGWLICGARRRFRIWQENECAVMYFLSNLVRGYLRLSGFIKDEEDC